MAAERVVIAPYAATDLSPAFEPLWRTSPRMPLPSGTGLGPCRLCTLGDGRAALPQPWLFPRARQHVPKHETLKGRTTAYLRAL